MYKLSIITINYNNASGLHSTIESIISQSYKNFEYCIIDGGSTDGSRKIIEQYQKDINIWVSEKDRGIYNAMNKGILSVTGEYLLFINSGDTLVDKQVLEMAVPYLGEEDLVFGDINIVETDKIWVKTYPDKLFFSYFVHDTLPHPGTFIKRDLFLKIGLYNENNKIVSDWEFFMLAIIKYNCSYRHIPLILSNFIYDGISSQAGTSKLLLHERKKVLYHHFSFFIPDYEEMENLRKQYESLRKENLKYKNSKVFKLCHKFRRLW